MVWYSNLETWANISTVAASVAVLATAVFVWKQVGLMAGSSTLEQARFRRESAQDAFDVLQNDKFRSNRDKMLTKLNDGIDVPTDKGDIAVFRHVVNVYEMLGLKIRLDAIDEEALRLYWRTTLLRDWERLQSFVEKERAQFKNPKLYEDAEEIVLRWKDAG
ncbi:DUF4760 domain-containing protein [Tropicimonas sp. TH_r6]|uniref:DUF4760 domain-containing protein n=1 Tax=Tropicimonas sp. TH_r6 TaxID=3082085 RepID=UPI002954BEB8|nr:DUF4760 domain-containing protein [Tropicimonas sp. TH_r6]MDV7142277.1 DUF4760 domain-containing protein [Tropicimonas sp. TH_r6]